MDIVLCTSFAERRRRGLQIVREALDALEHVDAAARGARANRVDLLPAPRVEVEGGQRHLVDPRVERLEPAGPGVRSLLPRRPGRAPGEEDEPHGLGGREVLHGADPDDGLERSGHAGPVEAADELVGEGRQGRPERLAHGVAERIPGLAQVVAGLLRVGPERRSQPRLDEPVARPRRGEVRSHGVYTHPVGFGRPASLQAPLAGPEGNSA